MVFSTVSDISMTLVLTILSCSVLLGNSFQLSRNGPSRSLTRVSSANSDDELVLSRRKAVATIASAFATVAVSPFVASAEESIYAPKFVQEYDDFIQRDGWSYRTVTEGKGPAAKVGDRVVFDYSGYTVGYFGRPFQAKGGPQGGAFDKDIDYARTVLGSGQIVKGLEAAFEGMQAGGVRQVLIPYGDLSYPASDPNHDAVGPKPLTFSGQRALNFVLENPRLDRTLLFNVKVIRVDKPNASGGFVRG